jgi:hypothetical protein
MLQSQPSCHPLRAASAELQKSQHRRLARERGRQKALERQAASVPDSEPAEKQAQPAAIQPAIAEVSNQNTTVRPSLSWESTSRFGPSDEARTNTAGYSSSAAASAAATEAAGDQSTTALPSNNSQNSQKDRAVEMNLRLNMQFQAAGQEGSLQRRNFIRDLRQDLADASGMGTSVFNILMVSPGSIVVDMNAPEKAFQEIYRQSLDPNSRLSSGKVTRFTHKIIFGRSVINNTSAAELQHKQRETIKDHAAATAQEVEKDEDDYDDDHWEDMIMRIMGEKENRSSVDPLGSRAVLDSESEEEESSVCLPGMPLVEFEDELEWRKDEDEALRYHVLRLKTYKTTRWSRIACEVPGRSALQCRKRWQDLVKSGTKSEALAKGITGPSSSQELPSQLFYYSQLNGSLQSRNNKASRRMHRSKQTIEDKHIRQKMFFEYVMNLSCMLKRLMARFLQFSLLPFTKINLNSRHRPTRPLMSILVSAEKRLEREASKSSKRVHFKLRKDANIKTFHPLHKNNKFIQIWYSLLFFPIYWDIIAFGLRIAFCDAYRRIMPSKSTHFVWYVDMLSDLWLVGDMGVSLITVVPKGTYPGQKHTAQSFRDIAQLYWRHRFAWDVAPVAWYQLCTCVLLLLPHTEYHTR